MLLYGCTTKQLLAYLRTVLYVPKHHRSAVQIKKCILFQDRWKVVEMDMASGGTQPEQSNIEAFAKLYQPNPWWDLRMFIGIFGLYSQFLSWYKMDIRPWSYILSNQPQLRTLYKKGELELIQNLWNPNDQRLLEWFKKYIVSGPSLSRPYPYLRLYISTYWSKDGIGVVLLQVDDSSDSRNS